MTRRTRIKICGVRRAEDALAAAAAGADAIGRVFYPAAARNISVEQAREILAALPAFVTPVGVFVNAGVEGVKQTAAEAGLRHVQLNGEETPEDVARLRGLAVIKAVKVERGKFGEVLARWRGAGADLGLVNVKGLVLETAVAGQAGGTGVANDWATVREQQAAGGFEGLPPVIAAGGLTVESVGTVVRDVRPWAVDVSSGVEASLGKKSAEKIEKFVDAVRGADGIG